MYEIVLSFSDERGELVLMKSVDYGKTYKAVAEKIFSFGIGGRFLFASVMTGTVSITPAHAQFISIGVACSVSCMKSWTEPKCICLA